MAGITHVIHCAGATKACRLAEFYEVNQGGTRNVVDAVNAQAGRVQRLVHISSLAAAGPARCRNSPRARRTRPSPVSEYGKSKLAGELEVRNHCRAEYVILRPPAVYGPRDADFLRLFRAVKSHLLPKPGGSAGLEPGLRERPGGSSRRPASRHPAAAGKTYFVAAREVVTARIMAAGDRRPDERLDTAPAAAHRVAVADLPGPGSGGRA